MWKFNQIFFIAINCWPAPEKELLIAGKPKGSLAFLTNALKMLSMDDKFIILTHHIPIPYQNQQAGIYKEPDFYLTNNSLINTHIQDNS